MFSLTTVYETNDGKTEKVEPDKKQASSDKKEKSDDESKVKQEK